MICEFCGKYFSKISSPIEHVNIAQPLKTHYFCSHICKDKWCFNVKNRKSRILIIWMIGEYQDKSYFIKKLVKVSSPSLLGSEGKNSYFTSNLNKIERLELINSLGRTVLSVKRE